jgi:hypothetical protein
MKATRCLFRNFWQGACCAGLVLAPWAQAGTAEIDFAGFASFVYAKTVTDDDKKGEFSKITNDGEYRDFNKLGLRMTADLKDNLTFTAQMVAEGSNDYNPEFDWIFATYQITPGLALSAGKYRVPVFAYSDYLDTSYAYQWILPPISIYNPYQTPFKSMEGVKITYIADLGRAWTSELLVWGGKADDEFSETGVDSRLLLDDAYGIAWTVEREWLSLRAFYLGADTSVDVTTNATLNDLIYGSGAVFGGTSATPGDPANLSITNMELMLSTAFGVPVNLRDDLLWEKDASRFYGGGAALDFEKWFVRSEFTRIEVENNIVVPQMDSFYVMAGVRLPASVTVSLTYGEDKDRTNREVYEQMDRYVALNPALATYQGGLKTFADFLQNYDIKATTLSTRWDFSRSASLKFEYLVHEWSIDHAKSQSPQAVRVGLDLVF